MTTATRSDSASPSGDGEKYDDGSGRIAALHHDSTSSSEAGTPRVRTPVLFQTMHVDVHEHERWFPVIGWATSRLADDPPVFTAVLYGARALGLPSHATHTANDAADGEAHAGGRQHTDEAHHTLTSPVAAFQRALYTSNMGGGAGVATATATTTASATATTTEATTSSAQALDDKNNSHAAPADTTTTTTTPILTSHTPVRPLAIRLPPQYAWDGYWEVYTRHRRGTDEAGWRYGTNFATPRDANKDAQQQQQQQQQHEQTQPSSSSSYACAHVHFKKTQTPLCVVRYRTWRRRVRHVDVAAGAATTTPHTSTRTHALHGQYNDSDDDDDDDDDDELVEVNKMYLRDKQDEMALAETLKQQRAAALRAGRPWTADDDLAAEEQLRAFTRARRVQSRQHSTMQRRRTMQVSSASFANPFRLDAAPADPDDRNCPVTIAHRPHGSDAHAAATRTAGDGGGGDASTATAAADATDADAATTPFSHRTGAVAAAVSWAMRAHHHDDDDGRGGDERADTTATAGATTRHGTRSRSSRRHGHGAGGTTAGAPSSTTSSATEPSTAELLAESMKEQQLRDSFRRSAGGTSPFAASPRDRHDNDDNNNDDRHHRDDASATHAPRHGQAHADARHDATAAAAAHDGDVAALHDHAVPPPHYHREAQTTHGNAPPHGTDGQVPGTAQLPVRQFVPASPHEATPAAPRTPTATSSVVVATNDGSADDFDAIFQKFVSNPETSSSTS